jgi:REP-associated tyrosine transposase
MGVAAVESVPTRLRRLPHFPYTGPHRYLLTICTYEKRSVFTACGVVDVVRTQILIAAQACGFEVIAYCFMPDHVHLVAQGVTDAASLPQFMQRAKQRSGYHGKRVIGHSVWQAGYHDRVLWLEADTPAVVAYVLENPVRAGLVEKPGDYAFSGLKPEL